jgi:cell division protein FtsL
MRLIWNGNDLFDITLALGSRAWWRKHALILALVGALCVSFFSLVIVKNNTRQAFMDYQGMQYHAAQLEHQYTNLMLEKGAVASQLRVMETAKNKLNMVIPDAKHTVLVSPA